MPGFLAKAADSHKVPTLRINVPMRCMFHHHGLHLIELEYGREKIIVAGNVTRKMDKIHLNGGKTHKHLAWNTDKYGMPEKGELFEISVLGAILL